MTRAFRPNVRSLVLVPSLAFVALAASRTARAGDGAPSRLTADEVARRSQATSFEVRARGEELAVAKAAVDQAVAAFVPRVSGVARYTRLSYLTPPSLGNIVVAPTTPPGTTPAPGALLAVPFAFPILQDQYVTQATLQLPLSDYLLRLPQAHAAAAGGARAAALSETATRLRVGTDARIVYWTWVRALKQTEVAIKAVEQAKAHLADARQSAAAGAASTADVLRVEAQVASAELLLTRASNLVAISEQQLRTLMHDDSQRAFEAGETVDAGAEVPADAAPVEAGAEPADAPVGALWAEAAERRLELRALDESAGAARQQGAVARAAGLPRLEAVGNAFYANPNPRVLPAQDRYTGTWDATIQLAWAPTDMFGTEAARRGALARAAQIEAQRAATFDGVKLEVSQSAQLVREARSAAQTARRGLAAAEESYRVRRVLFQNGRATSVELTDAENELTRARLEVIGAEIDLRIARARFDHAVGRDVTPRRDETRGG